jgi:predicted MFS family arabinose efflux permease
VKAPWRALAELPRALWILAAAQFVNNAGTMAMPFLVLYLTSVRGFSPAAAGAVLAAYGAGALAGAPLSGWLCDRVPPTRIAEASLFLSGIFVALLPLGTSRAHYFAVTFLWSVLAQALRPAVLTLTAEAAPAGRQKVAFSLNRLAVNLGFSVGPAVGGFLAARSFPAVFFVDGATSLAAGAWLAVAARRWRDFPGAKRSPGGGGESASRARALRDARFLFFLAGAVPVLCVFFQWTGALPLDLSRNLGLSTVFYGSLFTLSTILIVGVEVPLNAAMETWPHARSLLLGAILVSAGFGGMALARGKWSVAGTVVVWTFGEMILLPSASAFTSAIAPEGSRGGYFGLYQMAVSVAFLIGPWAGTAALGSYGRKTAWTGCFALGIVAAAFLARAAREPKR